MSYRYSEEDDPREPTWLGIVAIPIVIAILVAIVMSFRSAGEFILEVIRQWL